VIITTLALGIGANAAVFSVADRVLFHPLTIEHSREFVAIYPQDATTQTRHATLRAYRELSQRGNPLRDLAAFWTTGLTMGTADIDRDVTASLVSDTYFTMLGVSAAVGRVFTPRDAHDALGNSVAVLSAPFWRAEFGGDRSIIGRRIRLNGSNLTVIGIAPDHFLGTNLTSVPDVWLPMSTAPALGLTLLSRGADLNDDVPIFTLIGRLVPGVDNHQVERTPGFSLVPLDEAAVMNDRPALRRFVGLAFVVVALTLLLACVNVANLLAVRAGERSAEFGIRTALGASVGRLAQQLLVESTLLGVMGGAAGLAVALVVIRLLSSFALPGGVLIEHLGLGLDWRMFGFTFGLALLTAIGFGAAPVAHAARANIIDALRNQVGQSRLLLRSRSIALATQVAISLVLLVGAGLFVRSLRAGLSTNIGFDVKPLAVLSARPRLDGSHDDVIRPYLAIVAEVARAPGVVSVAAASHVPLAPAWALPFTAGGATNAATARVNVIPLPMEAITDDYFRVLGVPLVAGRFFDARDVAKSPRVTIVNESAARAFWPRESPIGKQITLGGSLAYTIVGIVRDTKYSTLQDKAVPFAYAPMLQEDLKGRLRFIVRSNHPRDALAILQRSASAIAPDLRALVPGLVSDRIDAVLTPQRFGATLFMLFSFLALGVSAVGIYGTVAYIVTQRRAEIGIRMALGARRTDVLLLVLRQSGTAILCGIVAGVVGAAFSTRFLEHFLYNIGALDRVSFAGAIAALSVVSVGAVLGPAVRALRIDPARAIRST
jgi:predicted permease